MAARRGMPLIEVELGAEDSMQESPKTALREQEPQQQQRQQQRLNHLDWLRLLMVLAVVYAHTSKSGITEGGGFITESWLVDDRTLFDHQDYVQLYSHLKEKANNGPVSGQCTPSQSSHRYSPLPASPPPKVTGRSPLAVRWISIARQWTLPLLFWVSGAAVACSYRGGVPRGLLKLAGFTVLGMCFNAALWFLGPLDPMCFIGNPQCKGKGLVFDFTIVPWAGPVFAILFQMWYTVMLGGFCIVNWPFLALLYGSVGQLWAVVLQWFITMFIYVFFLFLADGIALSRSLMLLGLLGVFEVVFLTLVTLVSPSFEGCHRPRWLPVRAVHYLMGVVTLVQFGALPFAEQMESIGATYILYMVTGFMRFFNLGFIMTTAQLGPEEGKAQPLLSRVWPLALILFTFTAPSTNWDSAGMLTYPFFLHVTDRVLYVAGAVAMAFLMDRCSRCMPCEELPGFLGQTSLILYLFHPVLITVLLHFGMRSVPQVWLAAFTIALAVSLLMEWAGSAAQSKDVASDSSSSGEED